MGKLVAVASESVLRAKVLRVARSSPGLSYCAIAGVVGCHPVTVARHIASSRCRRRAAAAAAVRVVERADLGTPEGQLRRPAYAAALKLETLQRDLHLLARHRVGVVRREVAANPATAAVTLRRLSVDSMDYVRRFAAGNERSPRLRRLVRDADPAIRAAAAANPVCGGAAVARAAVDAESGVRAAAAGNPNCPPRVLDVLVGDSDIKVATEAVMHSLCGPGSLTAAAASRRSVLRAAAAGHPSCPPDALTHLGGDCDWSVRLHVARHPRCPPETLAQLAQDIEKNVSDAARSALSQRSERPAGR